MDEQGTRRRAAVSAVVAVLALALLAWLMWPEEPEPPRAATPVPSPTPSTTPTPEPEPVDPCTRQAVRGFVPRSVSVPGVVRRVPVLAQPRDALGVPGVPPVSDPVSFAWDRGGVQPGSEAGHVLLNAHTWPNGAATGNRLLDGLEVGDPIRVRAGERVACYRVTERTEVLARDGFPGWDAVDGPPQVVIVVCSGRRIGPGNWTHRTLWFADRV